MCQCADVQMGKWADANYLKISCLLQTGKIWEFENDWKKEKEEIEYD
jgi:hypothetical protein